MDKIGPPLMLLGGTHDGKIIERFEDYGIVTVPDSHTIEFTVKEITGEHIEGAGIMPGAWLYGANGETSDFDAAEPFLTGFIKWDGCSNWDFHSRDCMIHFCGRKHATSIGRLMDRLYQIASERMEHYDAEIADA
jgi:hypothetical protein